MTMRLPIFHHSLIFGNLKFSNKKGTQSGPILSTNLRPFFKDY